MDIKKIHDMLEELPEEFNDPEAQYELERMQDCYHNALQAEYLEKDSDQYDF